MGIEENKEIVRHLLEEVWNNRNLEVISELLSSGYVKFVDGGREIKGKESYKQGVITFTNAFPDMHFSINDLIAEDDRVVCNYTMSGTHQGELRGIPPTGKYFAMRGISIIRLKNAKIIESQEVNDNLSAYQQLGVLPSTEEIGK